MSQAATIRTAIGAVGTALLVVAISPARADDPAKILKSMTDHLAGQKTLSSVIRLHWLEPFRQ